MHAVDLDEGGKSRPVVAGHSKPNVIRIERWPDDDGARLCQLRETDDQGAHQFPLVAVRIAVFRKRFPGQHRLNGLSPEVCSREPGDSGLQPLHALMPRAADAFYRGALGAVAWDGNILQ